MRLRTLKEKNYIKFIAVASAVTSVVITPWLNIDSMIIPKLILVFCLALFFIPKLVPELIKYKNKIYLITTIVVVLNTIYLLIVMAASSAPLEQQMYGRTGRGLGFIVHFSLLVILLVVMLNITLQDVKILNLALAISWFMSSAYAVAQNFGLDIFAWNTKTNGIIGTLGNPNFQSSFTAMAFVPILVIAYKSRNKNLYLPIVFCFTLYVIYLCESTQGYVIAGAALILFLLNYTWFKKRNFFYVLVLIATPFVILAILGSLNLGVLSKYLYKVSVTSRGEFWRSALNTATDNPLGVGLDSFADYYLFYRDEKAANGIGEFTDNAHNFFLEYAATGGFFLSFLNLIICILVLICFIRVQKNIGTFDYQITAVFCAWFAFQLQTLISPGSISTMLWNSIFSGAIIGLAGEFKNLRMKPTNISFSSNYKNPFSFFLVFIGLLITFPLFNTDRLQLIANEKRDAIAAVKIATAFPESTLRYSRVGSALLESNLPQQALEVGRAAVNFNPNAVSAWALILANQTASLEERKKAAAEIMRLDPFNKLIAQFKF